MADLGSAVPSIDFEHTRTVLALIAHHARNDFRIGFAGLIPRRRYSQNYRIRRGPLLKLELGCSVEVERLVVWFDRIALRFPSLQSSLEEFDSQEMQGANSI